MLRKVRALKGQLGMPSIISLRSSGMVMAMRDGAATANFLLGEPDCDMRRLASARHREEFADFVADMGVQYRKARGNSGAFWTRRQASWPQLPAALNHAAGVSAV